MIWRSRSLSARSSKSIVFSRRGSSGSPEAGEVTSRLDQTCQALTITLTHVDELFCSAWNSRHRDLPRRVHPLPIEPFEQGGELGCGQPHHPVLDLRPAERALFQPLGDENYAGAVPEDQLDPVGTPHIIPHTVWGSRASPTPGIRCMAGACGSDSALRAEQLIFCSSRSASAFFARCPPGCATRPPARR